MRDPLNGPARPSGCGDAAGVAVAQIGARRHYAVPRALHALGRLERLVTDLHAGMPLARTLEGLIPRSMRPPPLERLLARRVGSIPRGKIVSLPAFGLPRVRGLAPRARSRQSNLSRWRARNQRFCESVIRRGLGDARAVYVYNAAGLEILRWAKARDLVTVVDQTAAPWAHDERLLAEERRRWPGWEGDDSGISDWAPLAEREACEWAIADRIVCGSDYVRRALRSAGVPELRCVVVPYACPDPRSHEARPRVEGPLRVLFVGTLELRKGVPYLAEAARRLAGTVEVRCVGPNRLRREGLENVRAAVEWVGGVPRDRVGTHYAWADVVAVPSISEGSANVTYEALAHGRPVVATPNAGSVVEDGRDGRIVRVADTAALAAALEELADDRDLLARLSEGARSSARAWNWDTYCRNLDRATPTEAVA